MANWVNLPGRWGLETIGVGADNFRDLEVAYGFVVELFVLVGRHVVVDGQPYDVVYLKIRSKGAGAVGVLLVFVLDVLHLDKKVLVEVAHICRKLVGKGRVGHDIVKRELEPHTSVLFLVGEERRG